MEQGRTIAKAVVLCKPLSHYVINFHPAYIITISMKPELEVFTIFPLSQGIMSKIDLLAFNVKNAFDGDKVKFTIGFRDLANVEKKKV